MTFKKYKNNKNKTKIHETAENRLARLNRITKDYKLDHYKVIDYEVMKPSPRFDITWTPYRYHKWKRSTIAHRYTKHIKGLHNILEVKSTRKKSKTIMHFDTDSSDILVDNFYSQSITNSL